MARKTGKRLPAGMLTDAVFRKWLIAYRKDKGLRLRQISIRTGIPISRLSDIERGKLKSVRLRHLTAFASAFGYPRLTDFVAYLEGK